MLTTVRFSWITHSLAELTNMVTIHCSCWLRHCATSLKVAGLNPDGSLGFFIDIILPAALWQWVDSASNRNEYQKYFLGDKGGRCLWWDNITTFICRLSWNLGPLTSWITQGLSRPVRGLIYLCLYTALAPRDIKFCNNHQEDNWSLPK
jgi:hypothetical protein